MRASIYKRNGGWRLIFRFRGLFYPTLHDYPTMEHAARGAIVWIKAGRPPYGFWYA